jgi:hypothetical protein
MKNRLIVSIIWLVVISSINIVHFVSARDWSFFTLYIFWALLPLIVTIDGLLKKMSFSKNVQRILLTNIAKLYFVLSTGAFFIIYLIFHDATMLGLSIISIPTMIGATIYNHIKRKKMDGDK